MSTRINEALTFLSNGQDYFSEGKTAKTEQDFQSFLESMSDKSFELLGDTAKSSSTPKTESSGGHEQKSISKRNDTLQESKKSLEDEEESAVVNETVAVLMYPPSEQVVETGLQDADIEIVELQSDVLEPVVLQTEMPDGPEMISTDLQEKMTDLLSNRFAIPKEDLLAALEDLEMPLSDVSKPTNLANLLVALDGESDISAVLTDESLYTQIKSAEKELNLLNPEVLEKQMPEQGLVEDADEIDTALDAKLRSANQGEGKPQTAVDTPTLEVVVENSQEKSETSNEQKHSAGHEGLQNALNQIMNTAEDSLVKETQLPDSPTDMEAIIRQLTDQIKLQVNADTTSMDMQLYPEAYGKLNLHVAIRDGVITAQLTVENETVRRALESQIVQLKQNMDERGLKVDAVEVTIESHEFERNLNSNQGQSSSEQQQPYTSGRKNINLDEGDLTAQELDAVSEEDALARKIMLQNGNRIDFIA